MSTILTDLFNPQHPNYYSFPSKKKKDNCTDDSTKSRRKVQKIRQPAVDSENYRIQSGRATSIILAQSDSLKVSELSEDFGVYPPEPQYEGQFAYPIKRNFEGEEDTSERSTLLPRNESNNRDQLSRSKKIANIFKVIFNPCKWKTLFQKKGS